MVVRPGDDAALVEVLREAQRQGLVGPGHLAGHINHARDFASVVGSPPEGVLVDLGSGGGLPGLVLASVWPGSRWVLLDGRARSARFLESAAEALGFTDRVAVEEVRAEVAAHRPQHRGRHRLVVARGLAPPAVTAECAAGFLTEGGRLVVSEPPGSRGSRWGAQGLATLGLVLGAVVNGGSGSRFAVLEVRTPCPPRFPRRVGIAAKRPLF